MTHKEDVTWVLSTDLVSCHPSGA